MKQIVTEIISTPGPRKQFDAELGEDAAAVLVTPGLVAFYVADGTSENRSVAGFSTRRMAVDLGQRFFDEVTDFNENRITRGVNEGRKVVSYVLDAAHVGLMREWSKAISKLQDGNHKLEDDFEIGGYLQEVTGSQYLGHVDFSTTIVCGIVTMDGVMQAAGVGDAQIIVRNNEGLHELDMGKSRVYVRLKKCLNRYRFVKTRITDSIVSAAFKNVEFVVAGSDGVGDLSDFLFTQADHFSLSEIRRSICRKNPNTSDDKALCVIQVS